MKDPSKFSALGGALRRKGESILNIDDQLIEWKFSRIAELVYDRRKRNLRLVPSPTDPYYDCVYVIVGRGQVVYVGQTFDLKKRLLGHVASLRRQNNSEDGSRERRCLVKLKQLGRVEIWARQARSGKGRFSGLNGISLRKFEEYELLKMFIPTLNKDIPT